jgi:hypothetical protein
MNFPRTHNFPAEKEIPMQIRTAWLCLCLAVAVLWSPPVTIAAETSQVTCTIAPYQGELKVFTDFYKTTEETAKVLCSEFVRSKIGTNNAHISSVLIEFADRAEQELDKLQLNRSADYKAQFGALRETFGFFDPKNMQMSEFKTIRKIEGAVGLFEPLKGSIDGFPIKETEQCAALSPGASCEAVFEDFRKAFNPYRSAYNNLYGTNGEQLAKLGKDWDQFLEVSKSQTALEVLLTTMISKEHFAKNHLVGPPNFQVIALHPQLVYDSMKKAADGSNQELGLAVEWAGLNFWDLKVPLGISVASVYVDRANVRDVGHGVMVHINNHYAVGWANYGHNNNSMYVTIDLLKMFEEKKTKYDEYMKSYL